jgi:hypothetical protein
MVLAEAVLTSHYTQPSLPFDIFENSRRENLPLRSCVRSSLEGRTLNPEPLEQEKNMNPWERNPLLWK